MIVKQGQNFALNNKTMKLKMHYTKMNTRLFLNLYKTSIKVRTFCFVKELKIVRVI